MINQGTKITELERAVMGRLIRGEDPWNGVHGVGSRRYSGAMGRLKRRGYVDYGYRTAGDSSDVGWYVTEAGKQMWGST